MHRHRKIRELIGENYVYAAVLHRFGINFYLYPEETLAQTCSCLGLKVNVVVEKLESVNKYPDEKIPELRNYPISLVIEYLKHAHFKFVKHKLPYLAGLISGLPSTEEPLSMTSDLKFIFPIFVHDFIEHIYAEEDTLFYYALKLEKATKPSSIPSKLYFDIENHSIQKHALDHHQHGGEMEGIRLITNNYILPNKDNLHLYVVLKELESFEKDLKTHACIEDEIFFPKAIALEKQVLNQLQQLSKYN